MNLVQFVTRDGERAVAIVEGDTLNLLRDVKSVSELAHEAVADHQILADAAQNRRSSGEEAYEPVIAEGRLLNPVDHPDPAHLLVTGTGLTHLGSATTRDSMHAVKEEDLTDSMKMFKMGLEGGKPGIGALGVQPEWFYKGDGTSVVAPEESLEMPAFALDGGEEPEIAGIYLIGPDRLPYRLGFALGNEFSDHVMEQQNYLYLAHSKLRASSFGPELRLGPLPESVEGTSRIRRNGEIIWSKPFVSGEGNMSHSLANLEHHHFKYSMFCRPGDIHVHYFGTATLSVADGITTELNDIFEIEAPGFGQPLRNSLAQAETTDRLVSVQTL
ncbi:MAG: AraD1 family protein [Pseudomonadota bacterium]